LSSALSPTAGRAAPARQWGGLHSLLDWRRAAARIPRRLCHHAALDVRNIPRRHLMASLRLQLMQLTGLARVGFACRLHEGMAQVWYWDEADADAFRAALRGGGDSVNGIAPWPEPLLRAAPGEGLHLLSCDEGCEAVALRGGAIRRTRWFRAMPDDAAWAAFVRDVGLEPAGHPRPAAAQALPSLERPAAGWKLSTRLIEPVPLQAWALAALVALLGAALIAGGLYELKLGRLIADEQAEIARIRSENAATLALHKELTEAGGYLAALDRTRPAMLQLDLMRAIAGSGLVDDPFRISLLEWEYRGGRLRLLFSVPADGFSLGDFLAELEKLPLFGGIRLMPDTPRGTVGIQASLAPPPGSAQALNPK
jgi:hypothetical protein